MNNISNWNKFLLSEAVVNLKNFNDFNKLIEICEENGLDTYIIKKSGFDRIHFSSGRRIIEVGDACVAHQFGRGFTVQTKESFEKHYEILTIEDLTT